MKKLKVALIPITLLLLGYFTTRAWGSGLPRPAFQTGDPVIAAAGDVACGTDTTGGSCKQMATSDVLLNINPLWILGLGDLQYEIGALADYNTFFNPSWGRLKAKIKPSPGAGHDYGTANAQGYFDYFNGVGNFTGPAGDRDKGYYAFDVGAWRIYAMNSSCATVATAPSCDAGQPQEQWLRADLAAHSNFCQLMFMHHPLWTSDTRAFDTTQVRPFWQAFYEAGGDLVLVGHSHFYERFDKINPDNVADPNGIREIIVGTGGRNVYGFGVIEPNSQIRDGASFGVLKLTLHPTSYDWQFMPAAGDTFTDNGNTPCHGNGSTPTSTPSGSNLVQNPGFETAGAGGAADAASWTEGTQHTRASDKFNTGAWSLKSAYMSTGTSTSQTVSVLANTNYIYSGYIWRAATVGGSCMDMSDLAGEVQLCTTTTGSWQFKSGTWASGTNTSVTLRLITDASPNNNIWFDDIALVGPGGGPTPTRTNTPVPTNTPTRTNTPTGPTPTNTPIPPTNTPTNTPIPSGNVVQNPGFEMAGVGGAADAANWTEGANHARASDKFNTGAWALKSTYRGLGTDTRQTVAVTTNKTYTYSVYIWKTNSVGGSCADMNDLAGEVQLCVTTQTGAWQFKSGTWNSGTTTSVTLRLITDASPTGDIWFDDISLQ
jgi:hypothetical protein